MKKVQFAFAFKKYFLLAGIFCMFLWNANAQNQQTQLKQTLASTSEEMVKDNEAIRHYRMGTIKVQTTPGAVVRIEQMRHEFRFGSSITSSAFNGRLSSRDSALYRETFLANFNCGVTENALKWKNSEPKRGQINFEVVDKTLTWADANRIPLRGHNIYWGIEQFVPDWVKQLDSTSLRSALEERGKAVASRYRGRFAEYDLNNEMIHGNIFAERLGPKITLEMANWVKSEDPSAKLFVNDYDITTGKKLNLYVDHIRDLLAMGVPLSGIGAQGHLHGQSFDRAALHNSLDQLAKFNLPISITEFNIPGQTSKFYDHRELTLTSAEESDKARELTDFLRICFAHPGVEGFIFWGFWEGANWIPQSSLYRRDWTPTPAGLAYRELVFNKWWTKWEGKADKNGKCEVPAFFGTHRVTSGNRTIIVELLKKEGTATVTMVPSGLDLLNKGLGAWMPYGISQTDTLVKEVSVSGQPFNRALRVNTFNKPSGISDFGLTANISSNLKKGDVLWISFKSRCIQSKRETGEAFVELRFDQLVNGKYTWPSHLERGVSIGSTWSTTSIPFVMQKDVTPADVKLVIKFDSYQQRFEIGPVTFLNCGQNISLADLPRSFITYDGGDPSAPWRKEAATRIEKYRKGDLSVKVLDAKGRPVKDAEVSVRMKRSAYHWGTAISSRSILDTVNPDFKIYRDTLTKYFNQIVYEMEMKWKSWYKMEEKKKGVQTKLANQWLRGKGMSFRGHVMVWPGWRNSPGLSDLKNDTAALRTIILNGIKDQTRVMRGEFDEWDVVNEPWSNHDVLDLLGKDEMVRWFKTARDGAPGVKLFLNDFTMFLGKGPGSESQDFYDNIKMLKEKGAPIDAIGEQAHIGGTPPGIPYLLERLDYFGGFGLPIQISELDIRSNDDEFKARYLGDFLTAVFSHPSTVGIVQWGFWAGQHWIPEAALWNKDWSVRPHGKVFTDLVTKTWWTNFSGKTATNGTCTLRGFCGDYEIIVSYHGKITQQNCSLTNKGKIVEVKL